MLSEYLCTVCLLCGFCFLKIKIKREEGPATQVRARSRLPLSPGSFPPFLGQKEGPRHALSCRQGAAASAAAATAQLPAQQVFAEIPGACALCGLARRPGNALGEVVSSGTSAPVGERKAECVSWASRVIRAPSPPGPRRRGTCDVRQVFSNGRSSE